MAELAGVLVGNYFLLECIAREGIVETYRARPTTRGGVDVILRLFRPEFPDPTSFREHFAEEVEKVWRCHSEYIQPLLEFGTGDELLYCATLVPEGKTLAEWLAGSHEQRVPVSFAVDVVIQLCSALHYAHAQGIVHGNIQPTSVVLDDEGQVQLTHFGMRRAYQEGEALVSHIHEGNAAFTAPEQALGMICATSDIYALGVLLFRVLSGMLPYNNDQDSGEIAIHHANDSIPSLRSLRPDISEEIEYVVRIALAKTPDARFATPLALAQALQQALAPQSPPVISSAPEERRIPVRSRRTPITWSKASSFFMLFVLLLALLGASFFIFSLPQRVYDASGLSFLHFGRLGSSPTPTTKTQGTPNGTATPNGVTPGTGSNSAASSTPTTALSPTPRATGTTPATPTTTPTPSLAPCVSGSLSIDGSQNIGPLLQQISSDYTARCPGMAISLGESGSRTALNALQQQQIDVASSDLTARASRNVSDHPIAALLYAVIVSPDVQISGLSSATLQAIYQGTITNWSQVGGPDEAITVYQRPTVDTVTAIFRAFVLGGQTEHVKGYRLKKGWVQAVALTPGAISYVPLLEAQAAHVTILAIDGAQPSIAALQQGSYPFWSVEHLYTQGSGTSQFQAYLPFLDSTHEANTFAQYGAIPISLLAQAIVNTHLPGPEI